MVLPIATRPMDSVVIPGGKSPGCSTTVVPVRCSGTHQSNPLPIFAQRPTLAAALRRDELEKSLVDIPTLLNYRKNRAPLPQSLLLSVKEGGEVGKMTMSESHGKVYQSKRDAWIVIFLWTAVAVMAIAGFQTGLSTAPPGFRMGMATLLLGSAGFILWVLYTTHYTLTSQALIVNCGPFRWKVKLESIQEIVPTRNPVSSPACSLDRLHIRYRGSRFGILISPTDKAAFLRDVVSRTPGLMVDGEKVIRMQ